jgi:hypothetical protein
MIEQNEQTRWLVTYLESRFARLEDRMDSVAEGLDERLNRSEDKLQELLDNQATRIEELNRQVDRLEAKHVKLDSQAGFVRNLLAFVGTAVLSLLGWWASTFLIPHKYPPHCGRSTYGLGCQLFPIRSEMTQ